MEPGYFLGIDLGTSSVKAALVDRWGKISAKAGENYDIDIPHLGWAEQNPHTWYESASAAIRRALEAAAVPGEAVAAVGLSGQMHGTVCLDEQGKLLRPAVIWADQRSREQVEQLTQFIGKENLGAWTGGPLAAGFMLPTWIWLRQNELDTSAKTRHLLLPKDYLRFRLTGQIGSEPSDASSTGLFDTARRRWNQDMLDFLDIDRGLLPPIHESAEIAGEITSQAASDTGLKAGTPVVFGGSDQSCQALGHGIIDPGSISCTIGTGGQIFAALDAPEYDPELRLHLFCHALPDRWHQLAATLSAGLSLKWLRGLLTPGESFQSLADSAAKIPPGSEGLIFLPYLAGERTPHMDPNARGAFMGLTLRHTRAHLTRAVMEGVVFSLCQALELMESCGASAGRIFASGGAVVHPLWRRLMADIFNRDIFQSGVHEASSLGAAMLAALGAGFYPDASSASRACSGHEPLALPPDPESSNLYQGIYRKFTQIYPAIKEKKLF
jgi:xylulokinase